MIDCTHVRLLCLLSLVFGYTSLALAQEPETIRFVAEDDGLYVLDIDEERYGAMPMEELRDLRVRLDSLQIVLDTTRESLADQRRLVSVLQEGQEIYLRQQAIQDSLLTQTRNLYEGYRDLYHDYRKSSGEPFLGFSAGLGGVDKLDDFGNSVTPVVLVGLSVKRFNIWGFVNVDQTGFIFGFNEPIRFNIF